MLEKLSLESVLREALAGVPGWRSRARELLGITMDIQCPICRQWFDRRRSGSGKTCGRGSCQAAYMRHRRSKFKPDAEAQP